MRDSSIIIDCSGLTALPPSPTCDTLKEADVYDFISQDINVTATDPSPAHYRLIRNQTIP